ARPTRCNADERVIGNVVKTSKPNSGLNTFNRT
ncbi:unnamed protein product, partial [Rotaria sp. Silwood2]